MKVNEHFEDIREGVDKYYQIAEAARKKGIDPVEKVEVPLAISLAEKAIGLISVLYPQINDKRVVNRILDLEKEYGQLSISVAFKIAEEIAKEKYCKFENLLQAIDAGTRVGFAYVTLGVVSSPIEGFTGLKIEKTRDGKEYFKAYFSGPIRSAGTTAGCVVLMLIDYLRENFGFAKYDPTEEEVKRYVTENYDYHERVTNLQYLPTEDEIAFLAKNLPIQIAGEPTEDREVSNYKDLDRIETNYIRGGMCLIFSEGLAQKAKKGLRLLKGAKEKGFSSTGWDFLEDYVKLHEKREKKGSDDSPTYIKDLVAGRPVFGHPGSSGSFRLRYGRSRNCGFSAMAVHPATMAITDSFISAGTQLKIEKPTKGCVVAPCDGIDGPIVKMRDGSVKKVSDFNEGKKLYPNVSEIIYLGDILVPLGDVINRNYTLMKQGFVEEWWDLELKEKGGSVKDCFDVNFDTALSLSKEHGIPLHPKFIFYWSQIDYGFFLALLDWVARAKFEDNLVIPYNKEERERFAKGKRALELIGVEHEVYVENVIIKGDEARAFLFNLGINGRDVEKEIDLTIRKIPKEGKTLEAVNLVCGLEIKDKAGTFIGARMGRPEKAKLRKLTGSPHVLFPVGAEGGRLRSIQAAVEAGSVKADFSNFYCDSCKNETVYPSCENCGSKCRLVEEKDDYNQRIRKYKEKRIDVKHYYDIAKKITGTRIEELPVAVKGVRGTSNEGHECENMAKGFLRAKYDLHVNKDGTIRYDITEMPITHFTPTEIGTKIEKLKSLGYEKDIYGKELENGDQILELFPHDIILPSCPDSGDEMAEDVFVKVAGFVDDELEKLYGQERYFNAKTKDDIIGTLFACIAPHICTAVVGRLIGFSKTQSLLASPFMHAAMRRDCDGDEAAVMLLMDMLLNFSRKFLPAHRGGTQDAPLVLNSKINAGEVDDQILDFEVGPYPIELYRFSEEGKHSSEVKLETVGSRMKEGKNPFSHIFFTHSCLNINQGVVNSSYKSLPTMDEKVGKMMKLCEKIRAVETSDVARLIIERHFIRDTRGNFRKFSMQVFRCVGCNEKFRRPPLIGKCTKCGGRIIFTISEGSIIKYLQKALELARTYNVSPYLLECLELVEKDIESMFGKEKEKQEALGKWFTPQGKKL
ncbi:DNA polymerase II large subunit [Candidatus Pacearchaeota archaeon]|nr:DNA polymerase II large subunit [Candidatus Pacearchaeota archaeon]OIO44332.1 MAG: DNA polymerase II large subunit [Candidatus Pacearchaeota archaeon CG1_02_39_14]